MKKILLVVALEEELLAFDNLKHIPLVLTGVGKLNAAIKLQNHLLKNEKPNLILNLGSAGSHKFDYLSLINCTAFFEHDMDATAFGYHKYQTPQESFISLTNGIVVEGMQQSSLYTGDKFITNDIDKFTIIDMEGYALAKVARYLKIPFLCVKFISDGGNSNATKDWSKTIKKGSQKLFNFYKELIDNKLKFQ